MKKLIIVLAVGMLASDGMAQNNKKAGPPPPPPVELKELPPPPPPPPPAKEGKKIGFTSPVIVNDKGYTITIYSNKEDNIILLKNKQGLTQKIRMSVWNAKPEYFENKYGQLPPPPPPPPAPPVAPKAPPKPPVPPVMD